MRDDEKRFLLDVYNLCGHPVVHFTPRDLMSVDGFYIHPKRVDYLLGKWSDKDWYDYGVNIELGWLTDKGKAKAQELEGERTMMLAVIPARAGSKGVKNKCLHPLDGRELIKYTVDAILWANKMHWVISTDIPEILENYSHAIKRPDELCQDDTPTLPVIQHIVDWWEKGIGHKIDAVMTLQPTSPLRDFSDINNALDLWNESADKRCLVSVCEGIHPMKSYTATGVPFYNQIPYDKHQHQCYTRNGAIFITSRKLLDEGRLFDEHPILYKMPKTRSIDIDDYFDLEIAEALLRARRN